MRRLRMDLYCAATRISIPHPGQGVGRIFKQVRAPITIQISTVPRYAALDPRFRPCAVSYLAGRKPPSVSASLTARVAVPTLPEGLALQTWHQAQFPTMTLADVVYASPRAQ